jgi:hypothetical protein
MEGGTVRLDDELEAESPQLPDQPGRRDQVAVIGLLQHLPGRPCPGEVDVVGVRRLDIEGTALGDPGAGTLEMLDRRRYVLDDARGVDVCGVFPGPVRTPMLAAALGRPIAPATRVGRCLERGWFMDPSVCVAKALAGFRQGRASVVVDPVDRAVVRLPRRVIRRLDGWALRHLTGA